MTPDQWAAKNRRYPVTAGIPGARNPYLTPYMVPVARMAASGLHRRVVAVTAAQCGKTDTMLDLIGQRMDQRPAPILYVGPTRQFIIEQFEPRVMDLLTTDALAEKVAGGKRMTKSRKLIGGAPLRLAHGGSSAALKSDPAALAIVDEYVELLANVKGQGRVLELVEARGKTHADFVTVITSTPSTGAMDTEVDAVNGLQFWKVIDAEDIECPMWRLWQQGCRFHWSWRCPHCGGWFVPRFALLKWKADATPAEAAEDTWLECPCEGCGGIIEEHHKAVMNAGGRFIAPGQRLGENGEPIGDPARSSFPSYWTSGLATPFESFGAIVRKILQARDSGDPQSERTVINEATGELWAPRGGETPEWMEVRKCALPYAIPIFKGQIRDVPLPAGVMFLTAGIDVQGNRLIYVVRGWGARATSWLLGHGEIIGDTRQWETWEALADLLEEPIGGRRIRLALVDTGFRPDKKEQVPVTIAYEFCRRYQNITRACKGSSQALGQPMRQSKLEVVGSKTNKFGLELVKIDTDWSKLWVHEHVRWPKEQAGAWYISTETSDDYCHQIVSEARIKLPSGRPEWVARTKNNHALDCFDPETELLTLSGWVRVADVKVGTMLATLNRKTERLEYQPAIGTVARRHVGKMIKIKGRYIDLMVTPNHRLIADHVNPPRPERIVLAKDLTIWDRLRRTAKWEGIAPQTKSFPATIIPHGQGRGNLKRMESGNYRLAVSVRGNLKTATLALPEALAQRDEWLSAQSVREQAVSVDANDWAEFLGWFVAEGHRTQLTDRSWHVVISQNPGEKQDRIIALLNRLPWKFRMSGERQMVITSKQVFDALDDCYVPGTERGCYRKCVPGFIKDATPEVIERFVDAAIAGDGWVQNGFRTYATTSRVLADGMQELFLKLCRSAAINVRNPPRCRLRGQPQFHVREIGYKHCLLRKADNTPIFNQVDYDGMVYCTTVENGTLVARRNGKMLIVGNCEAMAYIAGYMLNAHRLRPVTSKAVAQTRAMPDNAIVAPDLSSGVIMPAKQSPAARRFIPPPQF